MTTIIGIQHKGSATLIADSKISEDMGSYSSHPDMVKIISRGGFLIAGSGEVAPNDIMAHIWNPPKPTALDKKDLYHFMIAKVMPSLKECLVDNKYELTSATPSTEPRFQLLLAVCGELFEISEDFSVTRNILGLYGIGTGAQYALGAIAAGAEPLEAMNLVTKFNHLSAGPFQVVVQS